jgi:hypothetical protein
VVESLRLPRRDRGNRAILNPSIETPPYDVVVVVDGRGRTRAIGVAATSVSSGDDDIGKLGNGNDKGELAPATIRLDDVCSNDDGHIEPPVTVDVDGGVISPLILLLLLLLVRVWVMIIGDLELDGAGGITGTGAIRGTGVETIKSRNIEGGVTYPFDDGIDDVGVLSAELTMDAAGDAGIGDNDVDDAIGINDDDDSGNGNVALLLFDVVSVILELLLLLEL